MPTSKHIEVKIVFLAAAITLLLISVGSYVRVKDLIRESASVNHTTTVKVELESTFNALVYAESMQRGYILTKDTSFLQEFKNTEGELYKRLENVKKLTADNSVQQQNVFKLKSLLLKRLSYLKNIIALSKTEIITTDKWLIGKRYTDEIRIHIHNMKEEENKLLQIRTSSLNKSEAMTPLFTILLSIGAILILLATYFKIIKELKISELLQYDLQERTKELLLTNQVIDQKNQTLKKKNKELESFNYITSHDLQEPLRKIQIISSHLMVNEVNNLSETGKDSFNRIQNAANKMQALIKDLLAFSQTNVSGSQKEDIHLATVVDEIKLELHELIEEKRATIDAKDLCNCHVIRFQIHQLLTNLISNAIKFSKPDTTPHIKIESRIVKGIQFPESTLSPKEEYCQISVSDNGIGFDEKYRDRIFEVFQRLQSQDKYTGTGIGLAIVKKIVENHNGHIIASGKLNEGARFDVYIPAS